MQERFLDGAAPVRPEQRRRSPVPRWILLGLLRLAAAVLAVAAVSIGLALLIGHYRGSAPSRSIPVGLYLGGAALIVIGGLGLSGRGAMYGYAYGASPEDLQLRRSQAARGAYIVVGLLVIGLGLLLDWLL
jgi:hypothetical protein